MSVGARRPGSAGQAARRLAGQAARILAMLEGGPRSNRDLAGVSLKYTSRVSDLRAAGHDIRCEAVGGGLTRYTLFLHAVVEPAEPLLFGAESALRTW